MAEWLESLNDNLWLVMIAVGLLLLFIPVRDGDGDSKRALQLLGEIIIRLFSLAIGAITDAGTSTFRKVMLALVLVGVITFFMVVVPYAIIIGIQLNPDDPTFATFGIWILDTMSLGMADVGGKIGGFFQGIGDWIANIINGGE